MVIWSVEELSSYSLHADVRWCCALCQPEQVSYAFEARQVTEVRAFALLISDEHVLGINPLQVGIGSTKWRESRQRLFVVLKQLRGTLAPEDLDDEAIGRDVRLIGGEQQLSLR